jgi:hypothetical protein
MRLPTTCKVYYNNISKEETTKLEERAPVQFAPSKVCQIKGSEVSIKTLWTTPKMEYVTVGEIAQPRTKARSKGCLQMP